MLQIDISYFKKHLEAAIKIQSSEQGQKNLKRKKVLTLAKGDTVDLTDEERENIIDFKMQGRKYVYLQKLKLALHRIEDGSFGCCSDCGEAISAIRLKARPTAELCISCKEVQEKEEKQRIGSAKYGTGKLITAERFHGLDKSGGAEKSAAITAENLIKGA